MKWTSQRVAVALVAFGLGFFLQSIVLAFLRRNPRSFLARELLECKPRSRAERFKSLLSSDAAYRQALELADRTYRYNIDKRTRSYGKRGERLRSLKKPRGLPPGRKAIFHEAAFILEYYRPAYPCAQEERFGLWSQAGRWVCRPDALSRDSVVYSVGSSGQMNFEVELYQRAQPEVHAFNPAVRASAKPKLRDREEFRWHDEGLDATPHGNLKTLQMMMADNGHEYVDVLQISCGGCEHAVLPSFFRTFPQAPVGQLLVDVHMASNAEKLLALLRAIEHAGFRMFHLEQNWRCTDVLHLSFIHSSLCVPPSRT